MINDIVLMALKKQEIKKMNIDSIVVFLNKGKELLDSKYQVKFSFSVTNPYKAHVKTGL